MYKGKGDSSGNAIPEEWANLRELIGFFVFLFFIVFFFLNTLELL